MKLSRKWWIAAWPLNPSCRRVEKPLCPKKQDVVGSWALTGMTGTEEELVPINKTLCFPHRLTDKPFKSPSKHVTLCILLNPYQFKSESLMELILMKSQLLFDNNVPHTPYFTKFLQLNVLNFDGV
jgi:hypothetical protein